MDDFDDTTHPVDTAPIENCISIMKDYCSRPDVPHGLDSDLHSVVKIGEECLNQLTACAVFVEDLLRLEQHLKNGNKTKAMLLLMSYGSTEELVQKTNSAIEELGKKRDHFKEFAKNIEKTLLSPNCKCAECEGTGNMVKQEVFRDRGSPPELIFRTSVCTCCGGSGKVPIKAEMRKNLALFSQEMQQFLNLIIGESALVSNLVRR
jgi:hypothetical protein